MLSDFPPIGVVKGGNDTASTMKSDPDDMQSIVRFLLYANEFDIEGLVASAGTFAMEAHKKNLLDIIGEGKDSEASDVIIAAVDKDDPRPIYIGFWGGAREAAQAI